MCHNFLPGSSSIFTTALNSHQSLSVKKSLCLTLKHLLFSAFHIVSHTSKARQGKASCLSPASLWNSESCSSYHFFLSLAVLLLHSTVAPLFHIPACTHLLSSSPVEDSRVSTYSSHDTKGRASLCQNAPPALLFHTVRSFLNVSTLHTAHCTTRLIFSAPAKMKMNNVLRLKPTHNKGRCAGHTENQIINE